MSKKHPEAENETAVLQPESVESNQTMAEAEFASESVDQSESAKITQLEQENAEINERYLRLRADLENIRRRSRDEQIESKQRAIEEIISGFLPVFDNLERAVNAPGETESWRKGVEMVLRQFQTVMDGFGVKAIPAKGEIFDPRFHEAVMQEPADVEENTILDEMQRGYLLGEKVIRPSMVKVAKPI